MDNQYSTMGNWLQPYQPRPMPWLTDPNMSMVPPVAGDMTPYGSTPVPAGAFTNIPDPTGSQTGGIANWMRSQGIIGSVDPKTGVKTDGYGGLALGAVTGLGSLYLGMQQYNLAKESLANSKAQFERNFANQVKTTNTSLEDRQRARVASNAGAYQSVGDYMAQNGVR